MSRVKTQVVELPEMVQKFNGFYEYLDKSDKTILNYTSDLIQMFRFLKITRKLVPENINFEDIKISDIKKTFIKKITHSELQEFLQFIKVKKTHDNKDKKLESSTIIRKINTMSSFFNYLIDEIGIIEVNPAAKLKKPKKPERDPIYLSLEEVKLLINAIKIENSRHMERDLAIIMLMVGCGLRISEVSNLQLNQIKEDSFWVIGKGDKQRNIPLTNSIKQVLNNYLNCRMSVSNIKKESENYVFISQQKQQVNVKTIAQIVEKYITLANVNPKCTPHKLRHTSATLMYANGAELIEIQQILGHKKIATTQIYTHINDEQKKKAMNLNPINDLL